MASPRFGRLDEHVHGDQRWCHIPDQAGKCHSPTEIQPLGEGLQFGALAAAAHDQDMEIGTAGSQPVCGRKDEVHPLFGGEPTYAADDRGLRRDAEGCPESVAVSSQSVQSLVGGGGHSVVHDHDNTVISVEPASVPGGTGDPYLGESAAIPVEPGVQAEPKGSARRVADQG